MSAVVGDSVPTDAYFMFGDDNNTILSHFNMTITSLSVAQDWLFLERVHIHVSTTVS